MKTIDELDFYLETNSDNKFVGRVREFSDLRSGPRASRLDAIAEIIKQASRRLREIDENRL